MRIPLALLLAVALAAGVYALVRDDGEGDRTSGTVTLVGDSLNVGIEPYLADELAGWKLDRHDLVGRATPEGVDVLASLRRGLAPVVVVSLGTNDPDGSEDAFRALVRRAIDLVGPGRCLVWATVVREGEPRSGFNDVLADAAAEHRNVRLVDWAAMVAEAPTLLAADAVHGTPDGYAQRANETARRVRACAVSGT
jgi:hypothetical protein